MYLDLNDVDQAFRIAALFWGNDLQSPPCRCKQRARPALAVEFTPLLSPEDVATAVTALVECFWDTPHRSAICDWADQVFDDIATRKRTAGARKTRKASNTTEP